MPAGMRPDRRIRCDTVSTRPVQRLSAAAEPRVPAKPRVPAEPGALSPAGAPDHDLVSEAMLRRLDFTEVDLSGREADAVEVELCRFARSTLAGVVLDQATFTDCRVTGGDWANLHTTKSSLVRVSLDTVRLTGLQWVAGGLRDVTFHDCRMDLATFRFTLFKDVVFTGCNLARADFTGADLRGAQFVDCDLSGAQFAQATCAGTRFTRCELAGIGSVTNLAGSTIIASDLAALSHAFAGALGITIEQP